MNEDLINKKENVQHKSAEENFSSNSRHDKDEFEKIGVTKINPFSLKGRWVFKYQERIYDLAPAGILDVVLSPLIIGVDKLVALGCQKKNILNPEEGFSLLFSQDYFPNADVKLVLQEPKFNGWIYNIEELNLKGLMPGQSAWICPYLVMYYATPPKVLYIKLEEK